MAVFFRDLPVAALILQITSSLRTPHRWKLAIALVPRLYCRLIVIQSEIQMATMQFLKQFGKQLILHGIECVGLNRLARHRTRRQLLGLCYHGVLSAECPPHDARLLLAVTATQFDQQMRELKRNWNPVSVEQVRQSIEEGVPLPDRAALVTFDETAFATILQLRLPSLQNIRYRQSFSSRRT
jgi:hypothetical protein